LAELAAVMEAGMDLEPGLFVADLRHARGLDYDTGTVCETLMLGHESVGSIWSGGRYDDLAGTGQASHPGVGMSVGVTRILRRLISQGLVSGSRASRPAC
jgi:histidyl-tRNA synthetase